MARYIDADKAIEEARLSYCKDCNSYNGVMCRACAFDDAMLYIEDAPEADVVPKSDAVKGALIDLKRKIHDKAVYPHGSETYSYVNLKVFDAVLQNILNKYMEGSK